MLKKFSRINIKTAFRFASLLLALFLFLEIKTAHALTVSPPRMETAGNPGETLRHTIKLTNDEKKSKTLFVETVNFNAKDETGTPEFTDSRDNLAGWIKAPQSITMGPGEIVNVDFTINIPRDAEPGGYFSSVLFLSVPPDFTQGGSVALGAETGTLLLLRVNGNITDQAGILEFDTKDKQTFFKHLPVEFYFRFQNTGTDRVKPLGDIVIKNIFGRKSKTLPVNKGKDNVLPRSIRKFSNAWVNAYGPLEENETTKLGTPGIKGFWNNVRYELKNFTFGYYSAELTLAYGTPAQPAFSQIHFFIIPWELLSIVIFILIIGFFVLRFFLRRYNRMIVQSAIRKNAPPPPRPRR